MMNCQLFRICHLFHSNNMSLIYYAGPVMHDYGCLVSDQIEEVIMLSPVINHCLSEYNLIQQ